MSVDGTGGPGRQQGLASAVAEVSERATVLIREEIELAKTEITEKATRLAKGMVVGVVAGIFFGMALFFVLVGLAWLLYYELPIGNEFTYFWGFFAMAVILIVLGIIAGLLAAKAVRSSAPPVPEMAIAEARKIRETVSGESQSASADTHDFAAVSGVPPVPPPQTHAGAFSAAEQDDQLGKEANDGPAFGG